MRNKILVMILIICMLTGTINPKKSQATGVEIAIVIGVEVVNYLVLASIASGVAVEDIYEKKNENDGNWISVTNKNGNQFELASGAMYKLSQRYAKSLVDSLSKTQLKELSSAITIDNNTMKVSNVGEDTYDSINSMNEMIRNNPKLKSYLNSDTLTGKTMNQIQLELLKTAFTSIKAYNPKMNVLELSKTYPYYVLFPTAGGYGSTSIDENKRGYVMAFSQYPLFATCRQENLTGDSKQLFYDVFTYNGEKLGNVNSYCWFNSNAYGGTTIKSSEMTNNPFEFWKSGVSVVGNGLMVLGNADYIRLSDLSFPNHTSLNWERYVNEVASRYYSLPISCLNSMTIDTYMPYPKDGVRVKEDEKVVISPITSLDNVDDLAEYVNSGAVKDTENGRTIDNSDSIIRDKVINPVLDRDTTGNPPIENDLSWLDRLFEWFNKHLTSLGESIVSGIGAIINALGLTGLIEWIGEICGNILSGVVEGFKSIGNILEWIWELLGTGVIGAITGIGSVLGDILEFLLGLIEGIISGFRELLISLFVPSDGYLDAKVLQLRTKFSFADGIIKIVKGFDSALTGTAPPIVKLGSLDESNKYGINNYVLMDLVWFKRYKPTTDIILSAALWVIFIWRMFIKLPGIIAGYSAMTYADAKIDEYNNKQGKGD